MGNKFEWNCSHCRQMERYDFKSTEDLAIQNWSRRSVYHWCRWGFPLFRLQQPRRGRQQLMSLSGKDIGCHFIAVISLLSFHCCYFSLFISLLSFHCCHFIDVISLLSFHLCHFVVVISLLSFLCCPSENKDQNLALVFFILIFVVMFLFN